MSTKPAETPTKGQVPRNWLGFVSPQFCLRFPTLEGKHAGLLSTVTVNGIMPKGIC